MNPMMVVGMMVANRLGNTTIGVGMMVANRPGNTTIGVTAGMRTTRMTRKMMPGAAGAKEICHRLHLHNTSLHLSNMPGARARPKRLHGQSEQHALSATVHMVAKRANIAKAKANHNPVANMARARASMAAMARARMTKPSLFSGDFTVTGYVDTPDGDRLFNADK